MASIRSRWRKPDPANGPNPRTFPTKRQQAILTRLSYRRFAHSEMLRHFIGGEYTSFSETLSELFDGGYIDRVREHLHVESIHARDLVHTLTEKGRAALIREGIMPIYASSKLYPHEFLSSMVYDSIETGARQLGFEYLGWNKLKLDTRVPARHSEYPFSIKLPSGKHLKLDGVPPPFLLGRNGKARFTPGSEIDRNTEPLSAAEIREKWDDKIDALNEMVVTGTHFAHYGFESCVIPIVTTNKMHMRNIMERFARKYPHAKYPIFKTEPDWVREKFFPKPDGHMFLEPWHQLSDLIYDQDPKTKQRRVVGLKDPTFYLGDF